MEKIKRKIVSMNSHILTKAAVGALIITCFCVFLASFFAHTPNLNRRFARLQLAPIHNAPKPPLRGSERFYDAYPDPSPLSGTQGSFDGSAIEYSSYRLRDPNSWIKFGCDLVPQNPPFCSLLFGCPIGEFHSGQIYKLSGEKPIPIRSRMKLGVRNFKSDREGKSGRSLKNCMSGPWAKVARNVSPMTLCFSKTIPTSPT